MPYLMPYKRGMKALPFTSAAYAITSVKTELKFNGFDAGMWLGAPYLGSGYDKSCRLFQAARGLVVDGEAGPKTLAALFKHRKVAVESYSNIPSNFLCKVITLESTNDPGATGFVNPEDGGIAQISSTAHPETTTAQRFNASWAISWAAGYLHESYLHFKDWDLAVVSYNGGWGGAINWDKAGRPANSTLGNYLRVVKAQSC